MSFISTGGGPANWSAITIDADKDMGGKGLSNLKQVAAAMVGGDLIAKGAGGILVRIPAGVANTVLTSNGPGVIPSFQPGGLYLNRYYPVSIYNAILESVINAADQSISKTIPLSSVYKYAYTDDPTDFIKLKTPALASSVTPTMIAAADQSKAITAGPMHRFYDIMLVVTAAIAYNNTGSVYTNETANADGYVTNGMTLLPAVPSTNCAYYFGFPYLFDSISLVIGTQGAGTWTIVWEYWNGGAWAALTGVTDGTSGFTSGTGTKTVIFTRGAGWATTSVNAVGPYYYVRARVSAYTSITTQPKGSGSSLVQTTYN